MHGVKETARPRCRLKGSIKLKLCETGSDVNYIKLLQDRIKGIGNEVF